MYGGGDGRGRPGAGGGGGGGSGGKGMSVLLEEHVHRQPDTTQEEHIEPVPQGTGLPLSEPAEGKQV